MYWLATVLCVRLSLLFMEAQSALTRPVVFLRVIDAIACLFLGIGYILADDTIAVNLIAVVVTVLEVVFSPVQTGWSVHGLDNLMLSRLLSLLALSFISTSATIVPILFVGTGVTLDVIVLVWSVARK